MPEDFDEFMQRFRAGEFAAGRIPFGKPGEWRLKTTESDFAQRYTQGVTCKNKENKTYCTVSFSSEKPTDEGLEHARKGSKRSVHPPKFIDIKPKIRANTFTDVVDSLAFETVTSHDRASGFGVQFSPGSIEFDFIDHERARLLHQDIPGRGVGVDVIRKGKDAKFVYDKPQKWGEPTLPEPEYTITRKGKPIPGRLREYLKQRQLQFFEGDAPEIERQPHKKLPFLIADPRASYTVCAFNARHKQLFCAYDESKLE